MTAADLQTKAKPHGRFAILHTSASAPGASGEQLAERNVGTGPEQREAFLDELQQTLQDLFTRYGGAEGDAFRLAVACYPKGNPDDRA